MLTINYLSLVLSFKSSNPLNQNTDMKDAPWSLVNYFAKNKSCFDSEDARDLLVDHVSIKKTPYCKHYQ